MKKVKIVYKDSQDDSINTETFETVDTMYDVLKWFRRQFEWPITILYAQNVEL